MRTFRRIAAVALVVGLASGAVHGCSSEEPFESVCLWVADPDNCYRSFRADMVANGETCKPMGDPSPVDLADSSNPNGTSNGSFLSRDKLDVCLIAGGGQVVFDPPIDLASSPPSPLADPITYKMTFKRPNGSDCGLATYSSPHGFSFTINPPPNGGAAASSDASTTNADAGDPVRYGSYTQVIQPGRDAFDATCPTGESHHFNLFEVEGASVTEDGGTRSSCPLVAQLVPRAALIINPGGIGVPGAVSFTIYWPPTDDAVYLEDALARSGAALEPVAVTYVNCAIAAAPRPCEDGVRDLDETDVDCGGPELTPSCPARCPAGAACLTGVDCKSGTCTNVVCK